MPFKTRHKLVVCPECGAGYVTEKQLEYLRGHLGAKSEVLAGCPRCRGKMRAEKLRELYEQLMPF